MSQDKQSAIESAAEAFVKFNADNEWSLSQVQGFRYGQDHVVRDCMLPGDRQEIWRRPVSNTSPEDMRNFIDLYCTQQAMGAAILAYLNALVEDEGAVEACARAICKSEEVPPDEVCATWEGGSVLQWETYRDATRAVLRTLATREQGEKP
jgi:hypothetical protein